MPNARAKALAGIHKAATLTWRRRASHCANPRTGPSASPMRKASPYTNTSLGSAWAPPPPDPDPRDMTVLGIIPSVQAKNAPAPVAAVHLRHGIRGRALRSTSHWAGPHRRALHEGARRDG